MLIEVGIREESQEEDGQGAEEAECQPPGAETGNSC